MLIEQLDDVQKSLFRCGLFAEGGQLGELVLWNMAVRNTRSFHSKSPYNYNFEGNIIEKEHVSFFLREWNGSSDALSSACTLRFQKINDFLKWSKLKLSKQNQYYLNRLYISNAFAFGGCENSQAELFYYMGKSSLDDNRRYSAYGFIQKSIDLELEKESAELHIDAIDLLKKITDSETWSTVNQEQIDLYLNLADEFHELLWILDEYDWVELFNE